MKQNGIKVGKYRIVKNKTIVELETELESTKSLSELQMNKINELHSTVETFKKLLDLEQQNTRMGYGK